MTNEIELQEKVSTELSTSRKLYQLASLLITHLSRYEDTTRFDNILMDIVLNATKNSFQSNQVPEDPTALI